METHNRGRVKVGLLEKKIDVGTKDIMARKERKQNKILGGF